MERGNDGVPAVFREMLEDVTEVAESVEPSPSKRRRRAGETTISLNSSRSATAAVTSDSNKRQDDTKSSEAIKEVPSLQTVVKRSDSSDESEVEWEEVELNAGEQSHDKAMNPEPDEPLSITIGGDEAPKQHQKRKARRPLSLAEKKMRLDIHKVHIVFLLFHSFSRNHWCNDAQVQVGAAQLHSRFLML
jgi:xeroderma pigmentosum group C-complementing protein